jgi:hypothetical protein
VADKVHNVIEKLGDNVELEVVETLSDIRNSLNAFSKIQKVITDGYCDKILERAVSEIEAYYLNLDQEMELTKDAHEILSHLDKIRKKDNFREIVNYDTDTYLNIIIDLHKAIGWESNNDPIKRGEVIAKYDLAKFLLTPIFA